MKINKVKIKNAEGRFEEHEIGVDANNIHFSTTENAEQVIAAQNNNTSELDLQYQILEKEYNTSTPIEDYDLVRNIDEFEARPYDDEINKIKVAKVKKSDGSWGDGIELEAKSTGVALNNNKDAEAEVTMLKNKIAALENIEKTLTPKLAQQTEEGKSLSIIGIDEDKDYDFKILGESEQETIEGVAGTTVTGESVNVNDVTLFDGKLKLYGNSKQEIRSGKNLLNFSLNTQTINGLTITNNGNGSITLNGTTTDIVSTRLSNVMNNLVPGNYYLSRNSNGIVDKTFTTILYGNNGNAVNIGGLTSEGMVIATITDYQAYYLWLYIASGITFTNYTMKPQLEVGTVKTDWEQYGASPSPYYPSEIRSAGDNINQFDYTTFKTQTINGVTMTNNGDGSFTFNGTATADAKFRLFDGIEVEKIKHKTIIGNIESAPLILAVNYYDKDWDWKDYAQDFGNGIYIDKDYELAIIFYNVSKGKTVNNIIAKPMVVDGNKSYPFVPFGQGCITEIISNKNLLSSIEKVNYNMVTGVDYYGITYMQKIKPSTAYVLSTIDKLTSGFQLREYDKEGNVIQTTAKTLGTTFTTNSKTQYIKFRTNDLVSKITNPNFMLEESKVLTDYIEHQEQSYAIPTQKPFRKIGDIKDEFILKNDKWYERHYIGYAILNGNETWAEDRGASDGYYTEFSNLIIGENVQANELSSDYFTPHPENSFLTKLNIGQMRRGYNSNKYICFNYDNLAGGINNFKNWLSNNKPIIYYRLQEPEDILCTDEQNEILNQLYNTTIYMPTTNIYSLDETPANIELKYNYVIASPSPERPSEVKSAGDNINIFDKNNVNIINGYISTSTQKITTSASLKSVYIECKPNTTYTIQKVLSSRFGIGVCSSLPQIDLLLDNVIINTTALNLTINTTSTSKYLVIYCYNGGTGGDTLSLQEILDSIKVEEGSKATPYSEYGQGNINEVVCNKNKFNINSTFRTTGSDYISTITDNGFLFEMPSQRRVAFYIDNQKALKAGTYTISCDVLENTSSRNIGFVVRTDSTTEVIVPINVGFTGKYSKKVELTTGTTNVIYVYIPEGETDGTRVNIQNIQIEESSIATLYTSYQSQSIILPLQKEMCKIGKYQDSIEQINGKWYEKHWINKYVLTGEERVQTGSPGTENYSYNIYIDVTEGNITTSSEPLYCSHYPYQKIYSSNTAQGMCPQNTALRLRWGIEQSTNEYKQWLKDQYNAGTPVTAYVPLLEPKLIECTPEQTTILNQLYNEILSYDTRHIILENELGNNYIEYYPDYSKPIVSDIEF